MPFAPEVVAAVTVDADYLIRDPRPGRMQETIFCR
jgi:hypothetical protein